ncbi:uncharacterized protein LOC125831017 [Solanum verrucosum]|uniref:uncharacterized protein LOC125831017 n=1 Tax=Solanum verrucosum TaxID=315347 RepID=UPI0020D15A4C|nr:uncharacterized protein LOC125831017 [Solanum verrucosum]
MAIPRPHPRPPLMSRVEKGGVLAIIEIRPTFIKEIKAKQFEDESLNEPRKKTVSSKAQDVVLDVRDVLNFKGRIFVPRVDDLVQKMLSKSHGSRYHSNIDMAPFEALYRRKCMSPMGWFEAGDVKPFGVDLVQHAQDKVRSIQAKLLVVESRHKKYANHKVRDMTYLDGEQVLLKVSLIKGVMRFGKKGKLSPRYIGPF